MTILGNYLPSHEEANQIRTALATLDFPSWVLNWDYEVGSDEDGVPAVWVTLYADERTIPPDQFGRHASEMIPKLRSTLTASGIPGGHISVCGRQESIRPGEDRKGMALHDELFSCSYRTAT